MSEVKQIICDDCGRQLQPYQRAHDCDGGEALRKAARELFAPTVPLIESVLAKAGTGILKGVFEVVWERDRLREEFKKLRSSSDARDAWQPIETAPKDCRFLACNDRWYPFIAHWGHPLGWLDDVGLQRNPTHWMPLPGPPALASDEKCGECEGKGYIELPDTCDTSYYEDNTQTFPCEACNGTNKPSAQSEKQP